MYCHEARQRGAQIVVFPEALLGGYPKYMTFGATVGCRSTEDREWFRRLVIVIGVIERAGSTLMCTALTFQPRCDLPVIHRKLMPTAMERLIWGFGDGSTMSVVSTIAGKVGCPICWENYMPAYRMHPYNQQVELWCAPTVDDRE
ncbi:unnamed protein product, partial [Didymodactylos carnosus]